MCLGKQESLSHIFFNSRVSYSHDLLLGLAIPKFNSALLIKFKYKAEFYQLFMQFLQISFMVL